MTEEHELSQENAFATAPIGSLIAKFAIPCVISLVVNGLYNIVDQIFIGNGVGYLGNSATNVVFPLTILCAALGVLFGDGAATYASLKSGQGNIENAKKGVSSGILMSVITAVVLFAVAVIFLKPIVYLFGCTESVEPYALGYGRIVTIGFPFVLIGTTLNSIIRADGSPKHAMIALLSGAIFNTIMDPIAIFVFHWGVEGAALATITGQFISLIIYLSYLNKWKTFKLVKKDFRLSFQHCKAILPLGISSFINQMAIVIMTVMINNALTTYGAESAYGADIPLAAMGITLKVNQIFLFVVVGIAAGAQPIIGFNLGAKHIGRVMKAFKICVISAFISAMVAFVAFEFFPMPIVSLFGAESDLYNDFAVKSFRIFLLFCIFNGFQTVASIFLQAIERPVPAMILSLSRQIVFFIPAVLILPKFWGIEGVLWAGPVADGLAFILALTVILFEIKKLKTLGHEHSTDDIKIREQLVEELGI
ncbi:MATE family efflux transporter [Fusibacter sp. 3D3]|uniref:MATE family efflux transporter n=1 Tax=Fusibacter sp. 3D3 TaxID=1048380 RepID=UPI000852F455|nr:MATE family efflux transporter [Fusibacter sp. 3D3]GAU75976.1 multi antimicrobial extrusion protein Na(+)/drug antiporter [Fusibacter sp. 3D3]